MSKIKKILVSFFILFFIISCGETTDDDNYVTTELNGLYRYKSVYDSTSCAQGVKYLNDASYVLAQPYFMLEGEKITDEENNVNFYYCEDKRFSTCLKEDDNGVDLKKIFAKGSDGNWAFIPWIYTVYDYQNSVCHFYKEVTFEYTLTEEKLIYERKVFSYDKKDVTFDECKISKMESDKLKCKVKRKYTAQLELISPRDIEYYENQEKNEEEGN